MIKYSTVEASSAKHYAIRTPVTEESIAPVTLDDINRDTEGKANHHFSPIKGF